MNNTQLGSSGQRVSQLTLQENALGRASIMVGSLTLPAIHRRRTQSSPKMPRIP